MPASAASAGLALGSAEVSDVLEPGLNAVPPVVPGVSGKSAAEACRWAEQAAREMRDLETPYNQPQPPDSGADPGDHP